jgi:hypothetical protein
LDVFEKTSFCKFGQVKDLITNGGTNTRFRLTSVKKKKEIGT